jgi:hypothetical protein
MNKKKASLIGGCMVIVVLSVIIYMFYFATPKAFPNEELLIDSMNELFPSAKVSRIQDVIHLNERNVFVPFISHDNDYGMSYWIWDKYHWKVAKIETRGEPEVWKINGNVPSNHHLVWNINPKDQLNHLDLYLIRDRGYSIRNDIHTYYPKVQMTTTASLNEQSYGVMPVPSEWNSLLKAVDNVGETNLGDWLFGQNYREDQLYIGWIPYAKNGKETFPEHSGNGGVYMNVSINVQYLRILNERELEMP